ncbi:MAG: chorismate mutase [Pseudomonadota bacterium]
MPDLSDLRQEIDAIDDQIHDLIQRRTHVVEQVRAEKGDNAQYMRPAREAEILRRLIQRHHGAFPINSLVRMWREMISSLTVMQGPLSVAVYAPGNQTGLWDVARDHYGVEVPLEPVRSPMAVLRAITDGSATVGVLPLPEMHEDKPWWPSLVTDDQAGFKVVGMLPFQSAGNARSETRQGMVVAPQAPEATGDDRSLLALHLTEGISRDRLNQALAQVKAEPTAFLGQVIGLANDEDRLELIELAGFLEADGPTLSKLKRELGDICLRLDTIGAYATPVSLPDPS